MELKTYGTDGKETGKIKLPEQFQTPIRKDVIKRAVDAIEKNNRQPYGSFPMAGKRPSAKLSRRRNDYRGSYGHGISRVPRKILSVRGTRFNWVGAFAPGTVGGRRAHPPKIQKVLFHKINAKENRFAIRSALAATLDKTMVMARGHKIPDSYPMCLDDSFDSLTKTSDFVDAMTKLGFENEMDRTGEHKQRAGKGKIRGRRQITRTGVLLVTTSDSKVNIACNNVPGFGTVTVEYLNAKHLAPGGVAGRAILFTKSAIDKLSKDKLYTEERVHAASNKAPDSEKPSTIKKVQNIKVKKDKTKKTTTKE